MARKRRRADEHVAEVRWSLLEATDKQRRQVARELVGVLCSQTQPAVDRPAALGSAGPRAVEQQEPVAFAELAERFRFGDAFLEERTGPHMADGRPGWAGLALPGRTLTQKLASRSPALAHRKGGSRTRGKTRVTRRDGKGGRRPQRNVGNEITATVQAREAWGEPYRSERKDGVLILEWILDEDGDGDVVLRLSGQETKQGETIFGQKDAVDPLLEANNLRPRRLLATIGNSGRKRAEERVDWDIIEEGILAGKTRWIAARGVDRLGRKTAPLGQFFELLQDHSVDLYLAQFGRKINWQQDELIIDAYAMASSHQAKVVVENTQQALIAQYPAKGRGWPGARPYGFARDEHTKQLYVDPVQWEHVQFIHEQYGQLKKGRGSGLRPLQAELAERGCDLSHVQISNILRNRMYVDGHYTVKVRGMYVAQAPVPIPEPISEEIFQRNQELLGTKGGSNVNTELGEYVLNYIPVFHERCRHQQPKEKRFKQSMIRCYNVRSTDGSVRTPYYRHVPPMECCSGWRVPPEVLEPAVMRALRELGRQPEVLEAWRNRRLAEGATPRGGLSANRRAELERAIGNLEQQLERLLEPFVEAAERGDEINDGAYQALIVPLQRKLEQHKRQLEAAEVERERAKDKGKRDPELDDATVQQAIDELFCDETPVDPVHRLRRVAGVKASVGYIVLSDTPEGLVMTVYSPLVPEGFEPINIGPAVDAAKQIQGHVRQKQGKPARPEELRELQEAIEEAAADASESAASTDGETVKQASDYLTLSRLQWTPEMQELLATRPQQKRKQQRSLRVDNTGPWRDPRLAPTWISPPLLVSPEREFHAQWSTAPTEALERAAGAVLKAHPQTRARYFRAYIKLIGGRKAPATVPSAQDLRRVLHDEGIDELEFLNRARLRVGMPELPRRDLTERQYTAATMFARGEPLTAIAGALNVTERSADQIIRLAREAFGAITDFNLGPAFDRFYPGWRTTPATAEPGPAARPDLREAA